MLWHGHEANNAADVLILASGIIPHSAVLVSAALPLRPSDSDRVPLALLSVHPKLVVASR